jgi:hypothetical protein
MSYHMFLDDVRDPSWVYPDQDVSCWVVCRSFEQAVAQIANHDFPVWISFDHDLGDDVPTGYDLAKWLVNSDIQSDGQCWPKNFSYQVHSANPVGAANIVGLLDGYVRTMKE